MRIEDDHYRQIIKDACRFANERTRLLHLSELLAELAGFSEQETQHLIASARVARFDDVEAVLQQQARR